MLNAATPAAGAPRGGAVPVVPLFLSGIGSHRRRLERTADENTQMHYELPTRQWMRQGMGRH